VSRTGPEVPSATGRRSRPVTVNEVNREQRARDERAVCAGRAPRAQISKLGGTGGPATCRAAKPHGTGEAAHRERGGWGGTRCRAVAVRVRSLCRAVAVAVRVRSKMSLAFPLFAVAVRVRQAVEQQYNLPQKPGIFREIFFLQLPQILREIFFPQLPQILQKRSFHNYRKHSKTLLPQRRCSDKELWRSAREKRARDERSEEVGEEEALCGAVSGGTGRGEEFVFILAVSATAILSSGAERQNMSLSGRELLGASRSLVSRLISTLSEHYR
jgi:hypothetical protein